MRKNHTDHTSTKSSGQDSSGFYFQTQGLQQVLSVFSPVRTVRCRESTWVDGVMETSKIPGHQWCAMVRMA